MKQIALFALLTCLLMPSAHLSAQEEPSPDDGPSAPPTEAEPEPDLGLPEFSPPAGRDVYLSTREGMDRIDIATPRPESEAAWRETAEAVIEVARNDLHFSGMFRNVDPSLYDLVLRDIRPGEAPELTAKRWQSIGAGYLLRSRLEGEEDQMVLEAYLVDLNSGDEVLGKRYTTSLELQRKLAHRLADDVLTYFTGSPSVFSTRLIYASRRGQAQEIFIADYDGANEKTLTSNGSLNLSPTISPDGTLAAFTSYVTGQPRLHLADIRTGQSRLLWDCPGTCQSAAWGPRGERLALSLSVDGNAEIYIVKRDGGDAVRLTHHPAIDVSPTWSPTGQELAFVTDRAGPPQIYAMDGFGLNVRRLTYTFDQATEPAWSPRGDKIAFTGRHEGNNRVCLLDLASQEESCFPPVGTSEESPSWSPDGEYLSFLVKRRGNTLLYMRRADGVGDAQPVFLRGDPKTPEWFQ